MSWEPLSSPADHTHEISETLNLLHRRLGLARSDVLLMLQDNWVGLLGAELARRCELESVRHEVLTISVDDPAIAEHLKWSQLELLAAANSLTDGENFSQLRIKIRH